MNAQRGFTLAELVVVMILTGILAAVAVPRFVGQNEFAARGARDFIAAALRYAQKSAIAMRRNVCVSAAATQLAVTYASLAGSTQACAPGNALANPANAQPYASVDNALPGGATLAASASLAFDALGRPLDAALAPLTAPLAISVNGHANPVTVEPETGLVH